MKSSLHRFRVSRTSPSDGGNTGNESTTGGGSQPLTNSSNNDGGIGNSNNSNGGKSSTSSKTTASPRSSHIPACDRCRSFKKRCSRTFPVCALCASAGQKCSFSTPASSANAQTHHLRARVEWLSRYINENLPVGPAGVETIETGVDLRELFQTGGIHGARQIPGQIITGGEGPASSPPYNNISQHGMSSGHSPASATTITVDVSRHDQPMLDVNLDDQSNHASPGQRSVIIDPAIDTGVYDGSSSGLAAPRLPPDAAARRFVDAYFRNVDRNKVLDDLEKFGDFAKRRRDADSTLLYLIMAIGCTTLQRAGQIPGSTASKFDVAYADIIQECLGREGIESIQIMVLLALYSLFDPVAPSAWSLVGIVARQAMLLGLTRRASDDKTLSPTDVELRHRLFWSIYVLDRMMATTLGLPVALTDENMDVPLPGLTIEEFASPDRAHFAMILQTSRHVIQLRQMEDRILRQVHFRKQSETSSLTHSDRRAILQDIRAEVENWYSNGCLVSPQEPDNVPIHNSITWLSARYYYLLLLLYYPSHFNSFFGTPVVSKAELLRFAQKHMQSTSALFLQRQLPLNRVSLCRLFPVGVVFMSGYLASAAECVPFPAREEVALLVNILDAFPDGWTSAHQAAQIFRQFLGVISGPGGAVVPQGGSNSNNYGAASMQQQQQQQHAHFSNAPPGYPVDGQLAGPASKDSVQGMLRSAMVGLLALMQDTLGKATCFKVLELSEERDMNVGNGAGGGGGSGGMGVSLSGPGGQLGGGGGGRMGAIGGGSLASSHHAEDSVMSYPWGHVELDFL